MAADLSYTVGGMLVTLSAFLQSSPRFLTMSTLLVAGKGPEELIFRKGQAQALMVSLGAEMIWTALHPKELSLRFTASLLLFSTAITIINTCLAFDGMTGMNYTPFLAFLLPSLAGCCAIPTYQCTAIWRIRQTQSPARFRILGWILTVGTGTVSLILPSTATWGVTALLGAAFPLFVGIVVYQQRAPISRTSTAMSVAPGATSGGAKLDIHVGESVPWPTAIAFVLLSVAVGTNAEAVADMAIGMRVRKSLSQGRTQLALANNGSVLASQFLALLSETQLGQGSERARNLSFLSLWCSCQLMRAFGISYLDGTDAPVLLSCMVFFDKYSGPLGQAALDTAGVSMLQAALISKQAKQKGSSGGATRLMIPAAFLVSLRAAAFKYERPFWDTLLLSEEHWLMPLPLVISLLTMASFMSVSLLLYRHTSGATAAPPGRAKSE